MSSGVSYSERSVSGIRTRPEAMRVAEGLAEVFSGETFAVVFFGDERVFDVEPAYDTDVVGESGVVALVKAPIQDLDPSID